MCAPATLEFHVHTHVNVYVWPGRLGERREEEAGGEAEDGPEESQQVNRRVENKVSSLVKNVPARV